MDVGRQSLTWLNREWSCGWADFVVAVVRWAFGLLGVLLHQKCIPSTLCMVTPYVPLSLTCIWAEWKDWSCFFDPQVDHIYIQSLRGIKDLHENGINETNFHEVQTNLYAVEFVWTPMICWALGDDFFSFCIISLCHQFTHIHMDRLVVCVCVCVRACMCSCCAHRILKICTVKECVST